MTFVAQILLLKLEYYNTICIDTGYSIIFVNKNRLL